MRTVLERTKLDGREAVRFAAAYLPEDERLKDCPVPSSARWRPSSRR
jgi:hypothetical protein